MYIFASLQLPSKKTSRKRSPPLIFPWPTLFQGANVNERPAAKSDPPANGEETKGPRGARCVQESMFFFLPATEHLERVEFFALHKYSCLWCVIHVTLPPRHHQENAGCYAVLCAIIFCWSRCGSLNEYFRILRNNECRVNVQQCLVHVQKSAMVGSQRMENHRFNINL